MKKKICFVVAVPMTAYAFLKDHIKALSEDYDVYLVASIKSGNDVKGLSLAGWKGINIKRGISPISDICAIWKTKQYCKRMRFDAIHSVTPKAGLVTALSGKFAGVKHRTHIFTGQVWATRTGMMRWLLKSIDKIIVKCDNHILVDGKSQRAFLVQEGVLREGQAEVFGDGSISGVNSERFMPDAATREKIREDIGIHDNQLVFIFLGRLNHDKGIGELYEAFNRIATETPEVYLLLVGSDEENYLNKLSNYPNIIEGRNFLFYGPTNEPEQVLNAGDVFVLPTYREGFGTSVLEAACIGLPCICSDAYGVLDAYVDGETGLRCKVGDAESLYLCMKRLYKDPSLVKKLGNNSRERALKFFSGTKLTQHWVEFYHHILSNK